MARTLAQKQRIKEKQRRPGQFVKGDPRVTGPNSPAKNDQTRYRDEVTQTLISILNEEIEDPTSNRRERKKKLYVMLDRLVALGLGVEFKIGGKKFQYAPDLKAINVILDRLIGKPKQQIDIKPEGGKMVMIFGEDDANEMA